MRINESMPNQTPPISNFQPTNTLPTTQNPYPQPTSKKKILWLVIALIVLLLGTTGAFAYKYYEVKQQLDNQQSAPLPQSVISSPSPMIDPTSEWKTYINSTFRLQFKYPSGWTVNENLESGNLVQLLSEVDSGYVYGAVGPKMINYSVFVKGITMGLNDELASWLSKQNADMSISLEEEKIGDYTVYRTTDVPGSFNQLDVFILKDNNTYINFTLWPYPGKNKEVILAVFEQILSTFQLLN